VIRVAEVRHVLLGDLDAVMGAAVARVMIPMVIVIHLT
jgi:hypothetical protein